MLIWLKGLHRELLQMHLILILNSPWFKFEYLSLGCLKQVFVSLLKHPHNVKRRWKRKFWWQQAIVCLAKIIFVNLFYYLAYFCYYSWVSLHFLILFVGFIVLFQLTFTFIYSTFSKKFSVSVKYRILNRPRQVIVFTRELRRNK